MTVCTSCGSDVTNKKFCPRCGTPVQVAKQTAAIQGAVPSTCFHCHGTIDADAAFCKHCGSSLRAQASPPAALLCPACNTQNSPDSGFCTGCGHNMRASSAPSTGSVYCPACGQQNAAHVRYCANCGAQLVPTPPSTSYPQQQPSQYPVQQQPSQYPQQQPYPPAQYPQPYGQPYMQGGYQPQPMMGQAPMVLRCPTCMALAPMGSTQCVSCRTSLAGVVPTPANIPAQGQGVGGFLQGDAGKYAAGALGGAAAIIGGQMLLHGLENNIAGRVEGDMGFDDGYNRHHHGHHGGLLGGLGELADDVGLI